MADAGSIRAGQAYVEITADDAPMMRRLAESQARLRAWAAQASQGMQISKGTEGMVGGEGGKGFLSGSLRGTEFLGTGLRFSAAIGMAKVALGDARIFTRLLAGDMDGARKAAESLPFGLGELVKEISGPVDAAMNWLTMRFTGLWQLGDVYAGKVSKADRQKTVDEFNRGQKAIEDVDKALAKATMTAQEFAKYNVAGMKLSADATAEVLAKNLQLLAIEEAKKAAAEAKSRAKSDLEAIGSAQMELAKVTMSEDEFLAYQVTAMGRSADAAASILDLKKETLRVERERKDLADQEAMRAEIERAGIEAESALLLKGYDEEAQHLAAIKQEAASLTAEMMTPEERGKAQVDRVKDLLEYNDITPETAGRAIRAALESAAGAAERIGPSVSRGMFGGENAWMLGALGVQDRAISAAEKTSKNTEKIARLAEAWGVAEFQ
jgi:hypothetical protein